jgi:hypothetical protein
MINGNATNLDRLHDLLADRATQYISRDEHDELTALLEANPDADDASFDRAAAAAELSWIAGEFEPMPNELRGRVEVQAVAWIAEQKGLTLVRGDEATPRSRTWIPWVLAAACLAIAVLGWWPSLEPASARRAALLNLAETQTVSWQSNDVGVTGDIVWNSDRQSGYLRFAGLPVNDPSVTQYQLWILDESRGAYSDDIAVDGGVFDIDRATGDVVVPIRAKLPIVRPVLFAVTTEPPGGVVKHNPERDPERYRIILTAPL